MITYIIGTDTDAGKTFYGKSLIHKGHQVIKPIETGRDSFEDISESDVYGYCHLQNLPIEVVNLYFFKQPLSPHLASERDGITIDKKRLLTFIETHKECFIELAGGLMVPITRDYTQLDLIKETKGQVDLVVGNKLGCINHALLTLKTLHQEKIPIRNVFINNYGKSETPMMLDNKKVILKYWHSLCK
ncbi:MAG: dethiobiotin synthase [Clostridiales bacterium]|nr:dethiobiotin synthase [Clostridiales bacterium]